MISGDNRRVIDTWVTAMQAHDWARARALYADEIVTDWPQTGERIRGVEDLVAVDERYPGGLPGVEAHRVVGSEDRWVVDAMFLPRRIVGSGDTWVCEATLTYPGGDRWAYAAILELRDGRIVRQTEYWAPFGEPPTWRADLVERTR